MPDSSLNLSTPLSELADLNPESLGVRTDRDYRFYYVDLAAVSNGYIDWMHVVEQVFASAPSRARRVARPGDVLFGTVRPSNRSHGFVPDSESGFNIVASTGFAVLRSRQGLCDPRFLFHYILTDHLLAQARRVEVGSGYPAVNESDVAHFRVPCLPLSEQRRVAEILDTIDETILKSEQIIAKLLQTKQGLLHGLLTRGIDKNGELRDPARHPNQFRDVESWVYGRLPGVMQRPTTWDLVKLTDFAKLESGHTPDRTVSTYWDGDIRWLSLHDTKRLEQHTITETDLRITNAGVQNSSARLLPAGTVALSRTATVGKCVILGRAMATSQDFACYVCGPRLNARYLLHLFRFMQPVWRALSGGSTHQTVYMPVFESLQVLLPPLSEQATIVRVIDSADERLSKEREELQKLRQLKTGLMADLLTRRVRTPVSSEATA